MVTRTSSVTRMKRKFQIQEKMDWSKTKMAQCDSNNVVVVVEISPEKIHLPISKRFLLEDNHKTKKRKRNRNQNINLKKEIERK
jgi:helix-turn-helix protein